VDTRLTVADVRAILYPIIDPGDANSAAFLQYLNQASERLLYSGKWKGSIVPVVFATSAGFITLPRAYLSVLAHQYADSPGLVFSQFHEYVECGPGEFDITGNANGIIIDMGDGFCTQTDITEGDSGVLRITITNAADAGKTIRFFGLDENGDEVYSNGAPGVAFTTVFPSADTSQIFSKVTDIQAATMANAWTLSWMDGVTATQIGEYEPGETRPRYRRYKTGVATQTLRCLCSRRFIPLVNETDWVMPGNIGALKAALQALKQEDANDMERTQEAWQRAYFVLNQETKIFRGGNRISIPINTFGYREAVPTSP